MAYFITVIEEVPNLEVDQDYFRYLCYKLTRITQTQTAPLKPGMSREKVERHLKTNGQQVKQRCCVASFRGEFVSFDRAEYDDLIKIAEESAPFVCNENNVYIAFEFNPKSQGELSSTNGSDILKTVSVFHQLEGCM